MSATRSRTKNQPAGPTTPSPGTRIPLGAIEIETGPNDRRRTIPPDVLAGLLEIAEALWYNDTEGWTAVDPERVSLLAHQLSSMLGRVVGDGGSLETNDVAIVGKLAEEIEARTLAMRGVNPDYYTVIVRDQAVSS